MLGPNTDKPILSICTTCRDGREDLHDGCRGGMRLAEAVLRRIEETHRTTFDLRAVRCMSQCKRACIVSLASDGCFSYIFGDLDPERPDHVDALLELPRLYLEAPEGFLSRAERPEALRANILGRLPPPGSASTLVAPLDPAATV